VLDERWSDDGRELAGSLRKLLGEQCAPSVVREAEENPDSRHPHVERLLEGFGLWELPDDPELLAVAAVELGRALAPVPFVELTPARVVLGLTDTAYGFEGDVPARAGQTAQRAEDGVRVGPSVGPVRRSAAGDLLRRAEPVAAPVTGMPADADRMWRLVRLLDAARLVGAARGLLDHGVAYSRVRTQFGRPIGSFQAVSHMLVDTVVLLDGAELAVRKAAWVAAPRQGGDGAPSTEFAVIARSLAVRAARQCATTVHQVMGGYGFTVEDDTQLYSRRIRSWSARLGHPDRDLALLARLLLAPASRDRVRWLWHHEQGLPLPRWAAEADKGAAAFTTAPESTGLAGETKGHCS
jgi:hypothetical protein